MGYQASLPASLSHTFTQLSNTIKFLIKQTYIAVGLYGALSCPINKVNAKEQNHLDVICLSMCFTTGFMQHKTLSKIYKTNTFMKKLKILLIIFDFYDKGLHNLASQLAMNESGDLLLYGEHETLDHDL